MAEGGDEVIQEILRSGLRDRDCENLSTGERMIAHATCAGPDKRIVCDCADIEPGVEIARALLGSHAADIAEGAIVAALATDSSEIVFHVTEGDGTGADSVAKAARGYLEQAALQDPGDSRGRGALSDLRVGVVHRAFRRNMKGYENTPTLLLTAETLLNMAQVLRVGAQVYRELGTAESPGTKVFQVSGAVSDPGLYELPLGSSLRALLEKAGGVKEGATLKAVIVGGTKGVCLTPAELDLALDFDTVAEAGGTIGSGWVAVLDETNCIVDETKRRIALSCYDLCATCSLGREGSYQLREILSDATRGKSKSADVEMMREIGLAMKIGAACAFGRTAPNILLSTLDKFPEEYEAHMRRRLCPALVCERYVTFHILPELCDGCGKCVEVCPEDAIEGGKGKIHVIDQDACEKCGKCYDVCQSLRHAVVKAGAVKPRTPKRPIPVGTWKG